MISMENPIINRTRPVKKVIFSSIIFSDATAVIAHAEHIVTHIPDVVHATKNFDHDFLYSLNLLSSPSFFILKNKNVPNLPDHIIIAKEITISPIPDPKLCVFE